MFRATDPIYIHTRAHVYIYTHIGATYIEIHISWGRDHRRVYLFTPTPPRLLIPIFTEPRRCGRVRTSVKSVSKVAIKFHPTFFFPLDKYIYIYFEFKKGEKKREEEEEFFEPTNRSFGMDIPSFVEYDDWKV